MDCPQCSEKAKRRGGGSNNRIRYYTCPACDITISVNNGTVKVQDKEPLQFRNWREARRVLYRAVNDDKEWFGEMTDETVEMCRVVFRDYLIGKRSKQSAKREQQISFGFARRKGK